MPTTPAHRLITLALPGVALLAVTACGTPVDDTAIPAASTASTATGASGDALANCTPDALDTRTKGTLSIATDKPAYRPWFVDDDPGNGKGYESAVGYAIADALGFEKTAVTWVVAPFNTVIAPGEKSFDFDLNQVSISDERKNAVDFSSGYYDVRQAVVTYKGSPIDGKTTVAELKGAKLGAQVGTTSYTAA
ncbi:MAG: transporter substrate-binding domain-containing protein, partial [Ornithinibacter sp.]